MYSEQNVANWWLVNDASNDCLTYHTIDWQYWWCSMHCMW